MNKKIIFSFLVMAVLVLPAIASAYTLTGWLDNLKTNMITIGASVVVIGWIIAGILYLTAAGEPSKLGIAKNALVACVIGTILVGVAKVAADVISNAFGGA